MTYKYLFASEVVWAELQVMESLSGVGHGPCWITAILPLRSQQMGRISEKVITSKETVKCNSKLVNNVSLLVYRISIWKGCWLFFAVGLFTPNWLDIFICLQSGAKCLHDSDLVSGGLGVLFAVLCLLIFPEALIGSA